MKINTQIIRDLNPCESRFNNYLNHYPDFDGDLAAFLALYRITYEDKVWVGVRLMSRKQYSRWAALCAVSVVHIYEEKFPGDSRPRDAIEAVLSGKSEDEIRKAAYAAHAAARAAAYVAAFAVDAADVARAVDAAAYAAARAAAYAANAADAADAASAGTYAATYAAGCAADAADAAAYAAARADQESKNLQLMLEVVEGVK